MSEKIAAALPREPADAPADAPALANGTGEPAEAPQVPARPPAPPHPLAELVERWWDDHFPGSHLARDPNAWNLVHGAVQQLKRQLSQI